VGQQQLLLIVLGVIIVGIAIIMGISLFQANAVEAKRNNVINELVNLASNAQQHYLKPKALGGGSRTFSGWKIPDELRTTANGHYVENTTEQEVIIIGTGNEVVTGNDSVKVKITVYPATFMTEIIN